MNLSPAPFYGALSEGPQASAAWWVNTSDGVRIRVGHFPTDQQARGTVLLFPGRTEYVEKYGRTAVTLAKQGFHTIAIDWRGQGLADRLLDDPRTGHVHVFDDYQKDLAAVMKAVNALNLPRPFHLIGHSMGGCIGLRALYEGLDVASAVFTGPMWGIRLSPIVRPAAWALSGMSKTAGFDHVLAPGTNPDSYLLVAPFEDNLLTTDRDTWDYMLRQMQEAPDLQLGGPSLRWLYEALSETFELSRKPSPDVPCLCLLGTNERIVDAGRIRDRMSRWPKGTLQMIDKGEHEVMMENVEKQPEIMGHITDFFLGHSTLATPPTA